MLRKQPSACRMLVQANPISVERARDLADIVRLDEIVGQRLAWSTTGMPVHAVPSGWQRRDHAATRRVRPTRLSMSIAAATVGALAILATPAFGFLKENVLSFFGLEKAPTQVQLDFSDLSVGAPAGMDPLAVAGNTRKVGEASFGGTTHTLWVAPTQAGGFCYLWTPGIGGCNASRSSVLDAIGPAEPPAGVTIPTPPADTTPAEKAAAIQRGRALATVTPWIVGFVASDAVTTVEVRFTDGKTAEVPVTRVSDPIGAGFYTFEVPTAEQTATAHLASVRAIASDGSIIDQQTIVQGG